jgi:hypothetical protein
MYHQLPEQISQVKALSNIYNSHWSGGKPDSLKPADLNKSGPSERKRKQEPNTTGNTRKHAYELKSNN